MPLQIDATLLYGQDPRLVAPRSLSESTRRTTRTCTRPPADADRQPRPGLDPGRAQPGAQSVAGRPDLPGAARPDRGCIYVYYVLANERWSRVRGDARAARGATSPPATSGCCCDDHRRGAARGGDRIPGSALAVASADNAAFDAAGLDWRMVAFDVAPGDGAAAVAAMRTLAIGGLAVTMPHKADVAAAVDEVDPAASALRSVNTVVLRDDGSTFGASTDGAGLRRLAPRRRTSTSSGRTWSCSAPAARARSSMRSAVQALVEIVIVNRRPAASSGRWRAPVARSGTLDDIAAADVVVNATSVGMGTDESPVDPGHLRR